MVVILIQRYRIYDILKWVRGHRRFVGVFLCPKGVGNLNFILYIYLFIPKLIITIVKTFLLRDEIYEYESNFSSHFVNYIWYNLVEELMTDQNITVILVLFTIIYWTWMIRYIKKKQNIIRLYLSLTKFHTYIKQSILPTTTHYITLLI